MTLDAAQIELLKSIEWGDFGRTRSEEAAEKKKQLLEMARRGEPRPKRRKHSLGMAFASYIYPTSTAYDREFCDLVRRFQPTWFVTPSEFAKQKKQELIRMAASGKPRPNKHKQAIGKSLCSYTNPKQDCYDSAFDSHVRKLRPDWFLSQSDVVAEKKEKLLIMARDGEQRPHRSKHSLGGVLRAYTDPTHGCYDRIFHEQIQKLRPDWFLTSSNAANSKKQELLAIARNGSSKPTRSHPLGNVFRTYTNPKNGCYDLEFDKQIRKLAPHWFRKQG